MFDDDDTEQAVIIVEDRNRILGIILQFFDTLVDRSLCIYVRVKSYGRILGDIRRVLR